mgnify:FL=1|tara:strand:+ start:102 stop:299 length:198 start_codon:yes stop_codon:yes gene_type:complete
MDKMTLKRKRIINLLSALKGIVLIGGASAYITNHEHITFWVLIVGAGIDETIKYLKKDIELDEKI